jgi:hypothetical protein
LHSATDPKGEKENPPKLQEQLLCHFHVGKKRINKGCAGLVGWRAIYHVIIKSDFDGGDEAPHDEWTVIPPPFGRLDWPLKIRTTSAFTIGEISPQGEFLFDSQACEGTIIGRSSMLSPQK